MMKRWASVGWRILVYESFNQFYDYLVYAWLIHHFGLVIGWGLAAFGSLVSCVALFWIYDQQKIDWLFAKTAREWQGRPKQNWFGRLLSHLTNGRKLGSMFALANMAIDPLIVAVHYRESHFDGISRRDWGVLFGSVTIANLFWGFKIGVLVKILEWLWTYVHTYF